MHDRTNFYRKGRTLCTPVIYQRKLPLRTRFYHNYVIRRIRKMWFNFGPDQLHWIQYKTRQ